MHVLSWIGQSGTMLAANSTLAGVHTPLNMHLITLSSAEQVPAVVGLQGKHTLPHTRTNYDCTFDTQDGGLTLKMRSS